MPSPVIPPRLVLPLPAPVYDANDQRQMRQALERVVGQIVASTGSASDAGSILASQVFGA